MTRNNILADKSVDFAIRMAKCYNYLMNEKNEFIMSKQMFRCGTSIGANIHEAIQAQSKADFISKLSISLKEASETSFWLVPAGSAVMNNAFINSAFVNGILPMFILI